MPHSLRAKIKGLRYKGIITDKDCNRLRKALDNEDVLDKIKTEISEQSKMHIDGDLYIKTSCCMQIIDKYTSKSEEN